jgi:hypothetical protein
MMSEGPRGGGRRGRKRWAWILYAGALVAMTIGLFLPSYGLHFGFSIGPTDGTPSPEPTDVYPGWRCAWIVTMAWEEFLSGEIGLGIGMSSYHESLILSYLPINVLFLISPVFLWLAGRTRRLSWVFRGVYALVVLQVSAWWVVHAIDDGQSETIMTGYWFWLGAYLLLAAAFWVMPGAGADRGVSRLPGVTA